MFKLGQEVYDEEYGNGVISFDVRYNCSRYPLLVQYEDGRHCTYTKDGKSNWMSEKINLKLIKKEEPKQFDLSVDVLSDTYGKGSIISFDAKTFLVEFHSGKKKRYYKSGKPYTTGIKKPVTEGMLQII